MKTFVVDLERTNQLSLLSDQDLVDLCPPIKPDLVTKSRIALHLSYSDLTTPQGLHCIFHILI
jgi:hypothetical protein